MNRSIDKPERMQQFFRSQTVDMTGPMFLELTASGGGIKPDRKVKRLRLSDMGADDLGLGIGIARKAGRKHRCCYLLFIDDFFGPPSAAMRALPPLLPFPSFRALFLPPPFCMKSHFALMRLSRFSALPPSPPPPDLGPHGPHKNHQCFCYVCYKANCCKSWQHRSKSNATRG